MIWFSTLRRWWRSWLVVAALVAAIGGATLAAVAAGVRTGSAYPRFVSRFGFDVAAFADRPLPALARFPEVASAVETANPQAGQPTCRCRRTIPPSDFSTDVIPASNALPLKMVSGRAPDPARPDEALASFSMHDGLGVQIGSVVTVPFFGASQLGELNGPGPTPAPRGPTLRFRIVGFEVSEGEFPAGSTPSYNLYISSAFGRRYQADVATAYLYLVRLRGGQASVARFGRDGNSLSQQGFLGYFSADSENRAIQASIHPQAIGWWALAVLAGLLGLAVIVQALARQTSAESSDFPTLAGLGVTRWQLLGLEGLRNAAIGLTGAVGAVIVAYLVSPLTPVGEARLAEPSAGFQFDAGVLLPGAVAVVVVTLFGGLWPSLFATRGLSRERAPAPLRSVVVLERLSALGISPSGVVGVHHALVSGRGRTSVPVRTALVGTVLAVTALCGTAVFSASLGHLTSTPALYGDLYQLNFNSGGQPPAQLVSQLNRDPAVSAVTEGFAAELTIGSVSVPSAAVTSLRGPILFATSSGRLPGVGEIALGTVTLRHLGAHLGSIVPATFARPGAGSVTVRLRVVGEVVLPVLGDITGLGYGALFSRSGFVAAVCSAPAPPNCPALVTADTDGGLLARFVPGPAGQRDIGRYLAEYPTAATRPMTPSDLVNFGAAVNFPLIFGLLVAFFGVATLVHMLVTSVARRRQEAGVLKALGFLNRQVATAVGWQATTTALVGLAVGVPVGISAGRLIWSAFAGNIGVLTVIRMPAGELIALAIGILLAAEALAVPAALAAGRLTVGRLLADRPE